VERSCDKFLDHLRIERNLSPRTVEAYANDLRRLRESLLAQEIKTPKKVAPVHLVRWLQQLADDGLRPSSQARALSAVRRLFAFLIAEGQLVANPSRDLTGPRRRRSLPVVPSRQQTQRLVEVSKGSSPRALRDRAALELLYAAGLRASELCRLRMDELNVSLGIVRPRGKGSKERVVPLGKPALESLQRYLNEGRPPLLKGKASPYVFIGNRQKPLSRMGLFKIVRRLAVQAGIPKAMSPHKLRHAFATHLLQGGADLRSVQEMLGHADISTTEIYTHVDTDSLRDTVDEHHPMGK